MAFDPDKDLDPICLYGLPSPTCCGSIPSLPAKKAWAEAESPYAKAHPRTLKLRLGPASARPRMSPAELFKTMAGLEWQPRAPIAATGPSAGRPAWAGQGPSSPSTTCRRSCRIFKSGALRAASPPSVPPRRVARSCPNPADHRRGRPAGLCRSISWQMVAAPEAARRRPILDRMAQPPSASSPPIPAFSAPRVPRRRRRAGGRTVDEGRAPFLKQETVKVGREVWC